MKIGQMSFPNLSKQADYLQLDICGLDVSSSVEKYLSYKKDIPVILHGDWTKKGCSENNLKDRLDDYIQIILALNNLTEVLGITIHPPSRNKMSLNELVACCELIKTKTGVSTFVENRSSQKLLLSSKEEIVEFSQNHFMTIDIPQLYISCGYNEEGLKNTLNLLNEENIKEIHLANVLRKDNRTFVARKLDDGILNIKEIISFLNPNAYCTLEILGGLPTFEKQKEWILKAQ